MKERTIEVLLKAGLPMNVKGFDYIVQAMELFDDGWKNTKITALYMKIGKDNNVNASQVERNLRYAFKTILDKGVKEYVFKYFDVNNKTNSAQLSCLYYRLSEARKKERMDENNNKKYFA